MPHLSDQRLRVSRHESVVGRLAATTAAGCGANVVSVAGVMVGSPVFSDAMRSVTILFR
jgi:hypothetical protein